MKRLLDGDGSELEQGLLDALRLERPSPELEQRMRAGLGLGPALVTAPPPAAPAAKTFGAWGAVAGGSVVAAIIVGGILLSRGEKPAAAPPRATPANVAVPSEPAEPAPTPAVTPEPKAPEAAPAKAQPQHAAPGTPNARTPSSASLREEIRLIDSARVLVKNNDGPRALAILDQYARRFPNGTFREEARLLRAEAQKQR
ncbi:MAG TPA: hypothetical protein VF103_13805 [Polyangiaceae bacterium]